MTRARCVMVLGTTSGAGKSWLTTALCRWYARQGLKVAPFKAQNMSNNARVVTGGEIGSAQYFQALAARAEPDVRMNPLLLKPEHDTHSQVVLLGQVDARLSRMPWRGRSASVWPAIEQALDELRAENDVVVIEGAGSPAEINLSSSDIVNMRVAQHADARCLLVTDIDRGGAFAHLYGTWALLEEAQRKLIHGFVLNKFRGDASLLAPAPEMLQRLTGIPTVATLPMWWQHGLPEEDGVFDDRSTAAGAIAKTIAVIAYPRISNLDEFQPLKNIAGVRLVWARSPVDVARADWIILPGSKHTSGDLAWLRAQGLDRAIAQHAERGRAVLGICGGLQMLGEALIDTHGIDGNAPGLGLLPLVTVFEPAKTVKRTQARFGAVSGIWAALSGVTTEGYEIHHGQTSQHPAMPAARPVMADGLAWQNEQGNVLGVYLHGMFEDPAVVHALFGAVASTLDDVFDGLADFIDSHFAPSILPGLIRDPQGRANNLESGSNPGMTTKMHIPDIGNPQLAKRLQHKIDQKTKPLGSLGRLEELALQLGLILGTDTPELQQPQLVVFAGDHGLAQHGVSAYPSEVTGQMVENFLAGGAAVSVLARQHGLALTVVDCGVRCDFAPRPGLAIRKIAPGTADSRVGPAMTAAQCEQAMANGRAIVDGLPGNVLLLGEMGIGNTSAASLLLSRLVGHDLAECVGAGTGLDEAGIERKRKVLQEVLAFHASAVAPLDALAALGGFEIATMVGAVLRAAEQRRVIVVDGFISTAAVLVARRLAPHVTQRCVFSHRSGECGHALMLRHLGPGPQEPARALLDLGLRLGEGSGAALAWPLLVSACALLREMASFESAGVSGRAA